MKLRKNLMVGLLAALLAFAAVACGDDDDGGTTDPDTGIGTTEPAPATS